MHSAHCDFSKNTRLIFIKSGTYITQAGRWLDLHAYPNKFRCHGNKSQPHNILHGSIKSAIPKNPLVGPNISGLSAIQADL